VRGLACRQGNDERALVLQREGAGSEEQDETCTSAGLGGIKESMERNRDNFEDFGEDSPEFSQDDASGRGEDDAGRDDSERETVARSGDEWFDPTWLRANGARLNEAGELERISESALPRGRVPVLVLVEDAIDLAAPGEEMESRMRAWGAMAWRRRRAPGVRSGGRVPTLLEQLDISERERRAWIEKNPFAIFWAATAHKRSQLRRRAPRPPA